MKIDPKDIPWNLRNNPRDERGYPIPFIIFRDEAGEAHFTVNNRDTLKQALVEKLCGLCGKPHKLGKIWFIGGPGAAFHETGLFLDAPVHYECGLFSMKVCPFIAAPRYSKHIATRTLDKSNISDNVVVADNAMDPTRPSLFVLARTSGYKLLDVGDLQQYVEPRRPWKEVQFWQYGVQITPDQARAIVDETDEMKTADMKWWPIHSAG